MLLTSQGFSCDVIMVLIYSKWRVDQASQYKLDKFAILYLSFLYSNKTLYTSLNILSTCILSKGETKFKQRQSVKYLQKLKKFQIFHTHFFLIINLKEKGRSLRGGRDGWWSKGVRNPPFCKPFYANIPKHGLEVDVTGW